MRSNKKPDPGQQSTLKERKHLHSMTSKLEPAISSYDTGQQIPCFDRCQLTITKMSNIRDHVGHRCTSIDYFYYYCYYY